MNAEEQLRKKPQPTKEEIRRARKIALVLAVSTIISVLLVVYAVIKKTETDREHALVLELRVQVQEANARADELQTEAMKNAERAGLMEVVAKQNEIAAKEALEECRKKRK